MVFHYETSITRAPYTKDNTTHCNNLKVVGSDHRTFSLWTDYLKFTHDIHSWFFFCLFSVSGLVFLLSFFDLPFFMVSVYAGALFCFVYVLWLIVYGQTGGEQAFVIRFFLDICTYSFACQLAGKHTQTFCVGIHFSDNKFEQAIKSIWPLKCVFFFPVLDKQILKALRGR